MAGHHNRRFSAVDRFVIGWLSLLALLTFALPAAGQPPPPFDAVIGAMQAREKATIDYRCRLETRSSKGDQSRREVLAYFYRRPSKIRMEVLEGPYSGSLLIYNPETDPLRVRVRAGNPLMAFLQRMLYGEFFSVTHRWVVDLRGNGIHESDWAHFIKMYEKFLHAGTSRYMREEMFAGRKTYVYKLFSRDPSKTMAIKEAEVWVDAASYFPVRNFQYDAAGRMIRSAVFTALRFNTGIDMRLFREFRQDAD